jgi:hypothetical protein
MSVLNRLITDAAKFGEKTSELHTHRTGLSKKLAEQFEKEGVESVQKRLPSVLTDVHKEMKGQGYELADYTSDMHAGHEIEGMAARVAPGYPGTRATWQHPETGAMAGFDLDDLSKPIMASNPGLSPGGRVNKELYEQGREIAKVRNQQNVASVREDNDAMQRQHAEIAARKAPAQSPVVAAANAPQAPAPSPVPEAPMPAAEPAPTPGKAKGKGKKKGKGKGGGGKAEAPAAPSVAQGSPVTAAQAAPPAPPAAPPAPPPAAPPGSPPSSGGQSPRDPAYQLAEHDRQMRKFRAGRKEQPGVRATTGSSKKPAPKPSPSPADPESQWVSPLKRKRDAKKLRDAADKSRSSRTKMSTYPPDASKTPAQEARRYEKPTVRKSKEFKEPEDLPGLKQKRHWGKGQKNLLAGMAIDAIGMPAIGGLLGALKGGYSYDPEQEQNDRYRGTEVIGRGNAMVQGAITGAGYGAAAAFGSGVMKGAGSLMGNGAFAHGGSVLGSFARGVKTGYKGRGTDTWTNTVGSSMAGESAVAADVMHKRSMAEVDKLVKDSGDALGSSAVKKSAAARRESQFGGMLSDVEKETPGTDDSKALQRWLAGAEDARPSNRPGFVSGQSDHSPFRYSKGATQLRPEREKFIGSAADSKVRKTSGVDTNVGTFGNQDAAGQGMVGARGGGLTGWNSVGATLSSIPNMLGNALGIAVGTVPMSIGKADDWYGESVSPGDNILPWKRKFGEQPLKDWMSRHGGTTENPMFDATKEASNPLNPFGENKKTTWNGKQTLSQIGAYALVGGGIIGNSGYSMLEDSAYSGPSSHPINALFSRPDQGLTARAQAEADASEKIRMTKPQELGLRDAEENYFQNPNLRPVRNGHKPGQYNDSGDLVFALSALRRGQ